LGITQKKICKLYCFLNNSFYLAHDFIIHLNFIKMKKSKKHTLLKGEGTNQHTLYGDFMVEEVADFPAIVVQKDSVLKHEQPDGSFSNEHKGLVIDKGNWSMGKQVEYNPFEQRVTQVWD
jgi:hypothetical protein